LYLISTLQQKKPDMKTVKYIRVSTSEQNEDRQKEKGIKHYIDKCSGTIPFSERPKARELINDIAYAEAKLPPSKQITTVKVHSISRLGRSTIDILETVKTFNGMGICLLAEKEGVRTLNEDGSENATAKMMLSILATLFEFEREMILERQREGIAKAKERGAYAANGGRPKENEIEFLNKDTSKRILSYLSAGNSIRYTSNATGLSNGTVAKVRKTGFKLGLLDSDVRIKKNITKEQMETIMEDKHHSGRTFRRRTDEDGGNIAW